MLAAMVVAVKHALDYRSWGRAIMVCALALALIAAFAYLFSVWFWSTTAAI
jgi:hypothetical protein